MRKDKLADYQLRTSRVINMMYNSKLRAEHYILIPQGLLSKFENKREFRKEIAPCKISFADMTVDMTCRVDWYTNHDSRLTITAFAVTFHENLGRHNDAP